MLEHVKWSNTSLTCVKQTNSRLISFLYLLVCARCASHCGAMAYQCFALLLSLYQYSMTKGCFTLTHLLVWYFWLRLSTVNSPSGKSYIISKGILKTVFHVSNCGDAHCFLLYGMYLVWREFLVFGKHWLFHCAFSARMMTLSVRLLPVYVLLKTEEQKAGLSPVLLQLPSCFLICILRQCHYYVALAVYRHPQVRILYAIRYHKDGPSGYSSLLLLVPLQTAYKAFCGNIQSFNQWCFLGQNAMSRQSHTRPIRL